MHIDTIRVQNFRCVRESGAIPLTPDLTIFIGENETGKTALLEALLCFNLENAFLNADLSTMSPTRESVLSGVIAKDTIDMVTIAIKVSATEREQFNIPANVLTGTHCGLPSGLIIPTLSREPMERPCPNYTQIPRVHD